ncbi:MAG TPA: hypothetical protein VKA35_08185 [Solirubrobacterales bacterium]|nr:hypothetical protein [Solirubrobacterales bacterium]
MSAHRTRNLIRLLTCIALCAAISTSAGVAIPEELPTVAVGQSIIYRLEVALLTFYGWLLLVTPAFSGLIRGRLPIEVSTRGARFAEEADHATELNGKKIEKLERVVENLTEDLRLVKLAISRPKSTRDSSQRRIGSEG